MTTRPTLSLRAVGSRAALGFVLGFSVACGGNGSSGAALPGIVAGTIDVAVDRDAALQSLAFSDETFLATDCAVEEGSTQAGLRRLLRFDTTIVNHGELPMTLGDPDNPQPPLTAADFELALCHNHHHFLGWALYELRNSFGNVIATGHKQAFCLLDTVGYIPFHPSLGYDCDFQGLSSGWGDVYDHTLDGQWVDVTGVPEGDYELFITINAAGKIPEVNDVWPDTVSVPVHVPDPSQPVP